MLTNGVAGFKTTAAFAAEFPDLLNGAMEMGASLLMHPEPVGPRLDKGFKIPFGLLDHEVNIERKAGGVFDSTHHIRPDGDVGHEMTIHHIHVNPVGTADFGSLDLGGKSPEIG